MRIRDLVAVVIVAMLTSLAVIAFHPRRPDPSLTEIYAILKKKTFVDLTHAFEPGIPRWPGFPDEVRETIYGYKEGLGTLGEGSAL